MKRKLWREVYKKIIKSNYDKNYKKLWITYLYQNNFFITYFFSKYCRRWVTNFYDHSPSTCLSLFLVLFVSYHAYNASSKMKKFVQLVVGDKIRTFWWLVTCCRHQLPYIRTHGRIWDPFHTKMVSVTQWGKGKKKQCPLPIRLMMRPHIW